MGDATLKSGADGTTKTTYDTSKPEIMSHPDNTSLWNAVVNAKTLTATTQFYISGGYYDDNNNYVEKYQYRPNSTYAFNSNDNFKKANGYADYGNCKIIDNVTTARNDAYFTVGESTNSGNNNAADVSYTLYLNTSLLSDATSETNQNYSEYPKNQKVSVWKTINYGYQSVTIQRNAALSEDKAGYDLLVNMVNLRPEDGYENQETNTDHWDVINSSRHMTKLDFSNGQNVQYEQILAKYPEFYNTSDNDIIYHYRVPKPQTDFQSLFMAFLPRSLQKTWSDSENDWNMIIRPQVQEGKTAKGLIGGVFVPEHQAMEALTPNLPNSNYAQFDVFLNISKSMYLLVPVNSYDLTGPAVLYYNPSSNNWENGSGDMWGNGLIQYHYTDMAYNKKENCWQYTGKFIHSVQLNEDGTLNDANAGFRIRTNQLYSTNYHEEPYYKIYSPDEHYLVTYDQSYADYVNAQTDKNKTIITTRPMPTIVPEWTTTTSDNKIVHNPYGPDSYYYNHVVTCETGTPLWENARNATANHGVNDNIKDGNIGKAEEQQRVNINFDLPDGFYTIKFYSQGDETGKPYYTLEEAKDPGTEIPKNNQTDYNYIRTYSANKAYVIPEGMDVFTVTSASKETATLHKINGLGYLPANTGLIIAYKTDISTGNTSDLEFSSDLSEKQFKEISKNYPRLNLAEYKGSTENETTYTKGNLLMPTTLSNGDTITSIPTTVFDTDGKTVKARNYGFYLKKTYTDTDHKTLSSCELRFQRVREWSTADGITEDVATKRNTPTAERAYLQLPAGTYGGTKYGDVSHDGFTEKAEDTSSAKFYSLLINFDDETTAINDIPTRETKVQDNHFYTLSGIRVNHPTQKGIYIVNGKKVVVR